MKKALYLLLSLVLLVAGGMVALTLLIRSDEIKQTLIAQVKQQTGRELRIDGPVSWSFFPSLGVDIAQVQLLNPAGFPAEPMISVASAHIRVAVTPLFSQQINIEQLELIKPQIHLFRTPQGHTNLDDLLTPATKQAGSVPAPEPTQGSGAGGYQVRVAGILIQDAELALQDQGSGQHYDLSQFNLTTGALEPGQPADVELSTDWFVTGITGHLSTKAQVSYQINESSWQAKNWQLELSLKPQSGEQLAFTSQGDLQVQAANDGLEVKLSPWLVNARLKAKELAGNWQSQGNLQATVRNGLPRVQLDTWQLTGSQKGRLIPVALENISASGSWLYEPQGQQLSFTHGSGKMGPLQWQGTGKVLMQPMPKVAFDFQLPLLDLNWFIGAKSPQQSTTTQSTVTSPTEPDLRGLKSLNLEGKLTIDRLMGPKLDARDLRVVARAENGIVDLTDFSMGIYQGIITATGQLDGRTLPAKLQLSPHIKGLQIQPLLKEWTGKEPLSGAATIDGTLRWVGLLTANVRKSLSGQLKLAFYDGAVNGYNLAAKLRNAKAMLKGTASSNEVKRTDFSALTADVALQSGMTTSNNISMLSPLLRVKGQGSTHLVRENLDFHLDVSVVGSSKGQGGKELDSLRHITIPLKIVGTWSEPDYQLDMGSLLKSEVQQQMKGLLPQRLPSRLGNFFN
jgi:AsmA protein